MIPNYLDDVTAAKAKYPEAWSHAHVTGDPKAHDFIKLLAADLYAKDTTVGNNGKRGNANDLSMDALNILCEADDSAGRTPEGSPCVVVDVIGGAGGPNPVPVWNVFKTAIEGSGAWVKPGAAAPPQPQPPAVQPYPDEQTWWPQVFDAEVAKRYQRAGKVYPDGPSAFRWASRTAYDIRGGMTKEDSLAKHLRELDQELGLG